MGGNPGGGLSPSEDILEDSARVVLDSCFDQCTVTDKQREVQEVDVPVGDVHRRNKFRVVFDKRGVEHK